MVAAQQVRAVIGAEGRADSGSARPPACPAAILHGKIQENSGEGGEYEDGKELNG